MKPFLGVCATLFLVACSGLQPYKDQSVEQLTTMAQHPQDFYNKVVCFSGEIKGLTEDTRSVHLVLKTEVPFYYYATGKGNALSYELLLVDYPKTTPQMSGLQKGNNIKVLARVRHYEKRKNMIGVEIGVLRLEAFALTDRAQKKDFFHETTPEKQLYEAWKKGRLFYQQTPEEIQQLYPAVPTEAVPPNALPPTAPISPAMRDIVYDEEEDFVLTP